MTTTKNAVETWIGADTRDVLKRVPFGCSWIIDKLAVAIDGPTILPASRLEGRCLIDYAADELAKRYGPAVFNTTSTRIIPVLTEPDNNGDVAYFELVPSLGTDGREETASAWDTLRSQIEYRSRRLGIMDEDERLDDYDPQHPNDLGNEGARSRIVEYLKGMCGLTFDGSFSVSVGDVIDALDTACDVAGVPIVKSSREDEPTGTRHNEVPWDTTAPEFIPMSKLPDHSERFAGMSLANCSKKLRKHGCLVRFMTQGQRTRVHLGDASAYSAELLGEQVIKATEGAIGEAAEQDNPALIEQRKAAIRRSPGCGR